MHDVRAIREDPAAFDKAMERRGLGGQQARNLLGHYDERRVCTTLLQEYQTEQKVVSKQIGLLRQSGQNSSQLEARSISLRQEISIQTIRLAKLEQELRIEVENLPNVLDDGVPDGADEADNIEQSRSGEPPNYAITPRQHF